MLTRTQALPPTRDACANMGVLVAVVIHVEASGACLASELWPTAIKML
jgi:hypothetical protein